MKNQKSSHVKNPFKKKLPLRIDKKMKTWKLGCLKITKKSDWFNQNDSQFNLEMSQIISLI